MWLTLSLYKNRLCLTLLFTFSGTCCASLFLKNQAVWMQAPLLSSLPPIYSSNIWISQLTIGRSTGEWTLECCTGDLCQISHNITFIVVNRIHSRVLLGSIWNHWLVNIAICLMWTLFTNSKTFTKCLLTVYCIAVNCHRSQIFLTHSMLDQWFVFNW